jgi:hypothetical protein
VNKLIFLLLLVPCLTFAQRSKLSPPVWREPTKKEYALMEKHNQCFNSHKYSEKQRASFFPFNEASIVKLVSFPFDPRDSINIFTPIAVNHFTVDDDKIIESRILSKKGIDSLTDILYNVGKTPVGKLRVETFAELKCYSPRNAILFINKEGMVTQYIELCFECQKYYFSSRKIKSMEYCEQKYEMLKQFFLKQGIQYGTLLPNRNDEN